MRKLDVNVCSRCGMKGHWARVCRTSTQFVDLYQASIKGKGKRFEAHSIKNALVEDIPTTPVKDNPSTPIEAKYLMS